MARIYPRILCQLILVFALSACGAASPTGGESATITETLTQFVLPPEITATLSPPPEGEATIPESPGGDSETPADNAPTPTGESEGIATVTPAAGASKTAPPAGGGSTGPQCNDAIFIEDVSVPDGTIVRPGQSFEKIWKMKNTGYCSWTTKYAIGFSHGTKMGGETRLSQAVSPGYTVDVSIWMTAPMENGWYAGWWRLKDEKGYYFGDFVYVSILVSDGSETPTPG